MSSQDIPFGKLSELQPWCHFAARNWIAECNAQGLKFKITEVYRPQERQDQLYAQGRTKPGKIVTWTKTSMHTKRLAADVITLNCSYPQIEAVAKQFGIYRPPELVKLGDKGHFQFERCMQEPISNAFSSPSVVVRRFQRLISMATNPQAIERLKSRLNEFLGRNKIA